MRAYWILVLATVLAGSTQAAAGSRVIPLEASLEKVIGPEDPTPQTLIFAIYDEPTGGEALWTELHPSVPITEGRISVMLGTRTPLDDPNQDGDTSDSIAFRTPKGEARNLFLGITLGTSHGLEMQPRLQLLPSYFAMDSEHAMDSDRLGGLTPDELVTEEAVNAQLEAWGLDALGATVANLAAALAGSAGADGLSNGRIVKHSDTEVRLEPYNSTELLVEVDGKVLRKSGPAIFDIKTALTPGSYSQAGFYYLYVSDSMAGPMEQSVSATGPEEGHFPGDSSKRYVGEVYYAGCGLGGVAEVDHDPLSGEYRLTNPRISSWPAITGASGLPHANWSAGETFAISNLLAGKVPVTATAVLLDAMLYADDAVYYIAPEEMEAENRAYEDHGDEENLQFFAGGGVRLDDWSEQEIELSTNEVFWLPIDGRDPKFAYAYTRVASEDVIEHISLGVQGWRSGRGPGQPAPAPSPPSLAPKLRYDYFPWKSEWLDPGVDEDHFLKDVDFSRWKVTESGLTSTVDDETSISDYFVGRYYGVIDVPTMGTYTFYTQSDDGTLLFIDCELVVDNDGLHDASLEVQGEPIWLAAGHHDILVTWFEKEGEEGIVARWEGPTFSKQEIPASVLFHWE